MPWCYRFRTAGFAKELPNKKTGHPLATKVDVQKFDEVKKLFHQDIRNMIMMDEVPAELVINWGQNRPKLCTGLLMDHETGRS